jgi:hypothetical protein
MDRSQTIKLTASRYDVQKALFAGDDSWDEAWAPDDDAPRLIVAPVVTGNEWWMQEGPIVAGSTYEALCSELTWFWTFLPDRLNSLTSMECWRVRFTALRAFVHC